MSLSLAERSALLGKRLFSCTRPELSRITFHLVICVALGVACGLPRPALAESRGGGSVCDGDWCAPCPPVVCAGGSILITPGGSGPTLAAKGLTVTVTILACGGEGPFVTFPSSEIQLVDESGGVRFCAGSLTADADTDAQGQTTFSGAIAGGGHGDVMVVRLGGVRLAPVIDLRFHSPDINGDLQVNLADVAEFATDFSGTYRFRSDFVHDGVLNLADIGVLARYVGEHCP